MIKYIKQQFKKYLVKQLINSKTKLTKEYLESLNYVPHYIKELDKTFWCDPDVKDRDLIWVEFENNYYRVYHSKDKTFIALEKSKEWFDLYTALVHNETRYKIIE